ncbi:MAG: hypothetical protein P3X22_007845 [Thermoprotei archaeon]|nr:hypothetical protein [Thermoprotei archaeon]
MVSSVCFVKGVYYEFIAFPCGHKYSMPLGLLYMEKPRFKVYKGTGLWGLLRGGVGGLVLLAPRDPLDFYLSLIHSLELEVSWGSDGCPVVDEFKGAWFTCAPRLLASGGDYDEYECSSFTHTGGSPPPYSRAMGCFVELLILLSKARAKVVDAGSLSYARWLRWCVGRASPGDERIVGVSDTVLRELEKVLGEG